MQVFVDCDPGIDDALALAYLAAQPEVRLVGVGTVYGNNAVDVTTDNALRLLELYGARDVPVAAGAGRPLVQPPSLAESVHGRNGLGDVVTPGPQGTAVAESAAELLVRLVRSAPGEIDVLALGPLTNLALALGLEPELPRLVRRLVVMGGAVQVPGNVTPWAEANVSNDPEAAEVVLGAGFDLTLVALDVTMRTLADAAWLDELAAVPGERAAMSARFLDFYTGWYSRALGERACAMHDPLAAAILVDPALVTESAEVPVRVELRGEYTRGLTVADLRRWSPDSDSRPAVTLATEVNSAEFLKRMLNALR
ncbi:nucleoside hydrolase [Marinitenerispora sediminis]|uniref:Nucleoside hydrolase n=1 Tax=Marinitenerispora sediminis TaxID=1931232 RepID=A0A368T0X2_9ACTN|nr:nucleoside hydrolase [Marinitenerispora sediminis]RCV48664.1 nucleoside hydrolase [Marinitenerispora sediminis]RCV49022.1 nucleoside hydrolase [Marinitenerispora sediminis]RCV53548.1 nucleoside hydrolase [Marinitenerispora sediminis]